MDAKVKSIIDPDNPPITDFSHFTMTAEEYWRKKLTPWLNKQKKVVGNETGKIK